MTAAGCHAAWTAAPVRPKAVGGCEAALGQGRAVGVRAGGAGPGCVAAGWKAGRKIAAGGIACGGIDFGRRGTGVGVYMGEMSKRGNAG